MKLGHRIILIFSLVCAVSVLACGYAAADRVILKDGRSFEGTIVEKTADGIRLEHKYGLLDFKMSEIEDIERTDPIVEYKKKLERIAPDNLRALYELGCWCRERGLEEQRQLLWDRVLKADPDFEDIRSALRHLKYDDRWVTDADEIRALGYAWYQGQWIGPEERQKLSQGLALWNGQWMTREEKMRQRGLVEHEGRWVTPQRKRHMERRQARRQAMRVEANSRLWSTAVQQPTDVEAWSVETEHYTILSDTSEQFTKDLGTFMEAFFAEVDSQIDFRKVEHEKLLIYVFRNQEEFIEFSHGIGRPIDDAVGGYYDPANRLIATFYIATEVNNVFQILAHEGTHQIVNRVVGFEPPLWIHEGLAEYFGTFDWDGARLRVGAINPGRLGLARQLLLSGRYIPLRNLVLWENQATFDNAQYAEAWSLVHFFFNYDGGRHIGEFSEYFSAVKQGMDPAAAFVQVFKIDFEDLMKIWADYVLSLDTPG